MSPVSNSRSRLRALISHYLRLMLLFIIEKPVFMLYTGAFGRGYAFSNWIDVIRHGLSVDLAVAAYLTALPLLLVIFSVWCSRCPVKKVWVVYDAIVALVLALIFCSDAVLYPFWGFKLDSSVFFYLRTPAEAFASIAVWQTVVSFAVVLVLTWLIWRLLSGALKPQDIPFNAVIMRVTLSFFYIILFLPLLVAARGGLKESTMNVGHAYFSSDQYLNHSAVNPAFSLLSSVSKTSDYSAWYDYFEENERSSLFEGLFSVTDTCTENLLNTDRPNVMVLVMEGFGGVFVNAISGLPDVTPCLDSLLHQGVYFSNCYAGSFRTDRGLVCVMNGHPGLPVTSIMKLPSISSTLASLPGRLKENGYSTYFMYGGDVNFTNMKSWLYGAGFQNIVSDVDFTVEERHSNAWGVQDGITFSRLLSDVKDLKDSLWFTGFLSLSSHEPFEVPYDRLENKIYNAFAYSDSCLGAFVDSLKNTPVWDNLLLMITPDHGFRDLQEGFAFVPETQHIPVLWLGGAVKEPKVIDRFTAQSDMAATILGQLGMDHSDFKFSRDVLSEDYDYPFSFYTFPNGFCFMDSTGVTLYDDNSGKTILDDGRDSGMRLKRGKAILQTLYDDLGARQR